jgi:hypothetical protein
MVTLVRLLHWVVVWSGAAMVAPPGARIFVYVLAAFIPAIAATVRETLRRRGIGRDGPSRSQVLGFAILESVVGTFCATIGLWVAPPLVFAAAIIVVGIGVVDLTMELRTPRWTVDFEADSLSLRGGTLLRSSPRPVAFLWRDLTLRRQGPTLLFEAGGKVRAVRFGASRSEEIIDEVRRRGATFVDEPAEGSGVWVPLLVAAGCSLLAAVGLRH